MTDLIRTILINDSTVNADSGGRIFIDEVPQGAQLPHIVLQIAEGEPNDSKTVASEIDQSRITIYCYGIVTHDKDSNVGAYSMLVNCRAALDHYSDSNLYVRAFDTPSTFTSRTENHLLKIAEQDFEVYLNRTV